MPRAVALVLAISVAGCGLLQTRGIGYYRVKKCRSKIAEFERQRPGPPAP